MDSTLGRTQERVSLKYAAAPAWATYYTFGREVRLPAGTRVRLYAGNVADAPPEEPGVVRRFLASLDERGRLRLPVEGAELRVSALGGVTGHARRFLPDGEYAPVDARVLRKADGTGFFIVAPASPAGFALEVGQYRLKMTYRRNNHAIDPDSQIFSQAGVTDPEQVMIDVPWEAH